MPTSDDPFADVTNLFTNRDALTIDYQPDNVVERDDEISKLANALNAVRNGWSPDNIFIYGKTGVGKTVVTRHVLSKLQQHVDISTVRVTCSSQSSYQTAIKTVNNLRQGTDRPPLPMTGHATQAIFDALYGELNDRGDPAIIVLDEVDSLGSDDKLLYELPRAKDNDHLDDDVTLGVIGISNDFTYRRNLSPKVKDSLAEKEIHFQPYSASELQAILQSRADVGVTDDVLEDGVIPLCAAYSSQEHGSARQAIELLREAVDLASQQGHMTVGEEEVRDARGLVEKNQIRDAIGSLTDHGLFALIALSYETEDSTGVRGKTIYGQYRRLSEMNGRDPLSYDRLRDQLDELSLGGFAEKTVQNKGEAGGRYNEYQCQYPYDVVIDAVSDHRDWAVFDI
ncbi:cell division control protein 6 [Haladaptatus paucihalophilus DX253]|uniref:ORC1-type DNA replication protein n=1 Tax=Haladaptatus paucihalophilus DX253 TaxID=797209 RepID=E7QSX6_HALPU|nr:orc1/cdc6 family replication initiation protein [Haladaptatus paucihalophilus]EFW92365.1 cell division control protein 6 [Haladaptatus paucihalophilus DX253]SHL61695.1 cell division control protein 6 [Haladaptatus paucihalophilus DX253]